MSDKIDELIRRFHKVNGKSEYTQRDLLKSIMARLDDLNDRVIESHNSLDEKIDETNDKMDNHILTNEKRITAIETMISNVKWLFGVTFAAVLVVLVAIFTV